MITLGQVDAIRQSTVYDSAGERIGGVGEVLVSKVTGEPEWVSVHRGAVGDRETYAPLAGATATDDELHLAVSKALVHAAPGFVPDIDMSAEEVEVLRAHYGG